VQDTAGLKRFGAMWRNWGYGIIPEKISMRMDPKDGTGKLQSRHCVNTRCSR